MLFLYRPIAVLTARVYGGLWSSRPHLPVPEWTTSKYITSRTKKPSSLGLKWDRPQAGTLNMAHRAIPPVRERPLPQPTIHTISPVLRCSPNMTCTYNPTAAQGRSEEHTSEL